MDAIIDETDVPYPAPTARLAPSAMASNTGCKSTGEPPMTFSMSAVAVCCAGSKSLSWPTSLNSRRSRSRSRPGRRRSAATGHDGRANEPGSFRVTLINADRRRRCAAVARKAWLRKPRILASFALFGMSTHSTSVSEISRSRRARSGRARESRTAAGKMPVGRIGLRVGRRERRQVHVVVDEAQHCAAKSRRQPFARCAIASNTGCTSEGELAMTFRMSAVAVCRSSASRSR